MYERTLRGKEKALGPEHTSTLNTVHALGILYRGQCHGAAVTNKPTQRRMRGREKRIGGMRPTHQSAHRAERSGCQDRQSTQSRVLWVLCAKIHRAHRSHS
ncbi:hypothetical protein QBC35DRAFT_509877 [Podospora australis]|uniref:Uncharacterized protein n=1 Tax=Podospora australis TaxID=1536484 RepID=A0AAN6WIZ8_9PEZI|nr:hypothetical protein QBC35DRAFT_509877 [Podospora australis]